MNYYKRRIQLEITRRECSKNCAKVKKKKIGQGGTENGYFQNMEQKGKTINNSHFYLTKITVEKTSRHESM